MGANAQTTVPTFTAGEVLTAAQQNASARTGVPVFATTGTRDAGFGGTGEKTLAEGQLCYVEGTGLQSYNGTSWVTWGTAPSSGALTLISSTTIGSAVSSVTVSSAFSSTYDNYLILLTGGVASAGTVGTLQLGSTATGYSWGYFGRDYNNTSGSFQSEGGNNTTSFRAWTHTTNALNAHITVMGPNLAKFTSFIAMSGTPSAGQTSFYNSGVLADTTQYTAFTLTPASGTLTGGTIRVYGYANS